jgi:predicted glycosyltransferase
MTRLMIWVQHLLGTGHLERMRRIAEAASDAGFDVHFVTGGVPIPGRMPRDVTLVQLPPIRVADDSFSPLRDAGYRPIDEHYRQARVAQLLAAYERAAPAVVLFETFPFGRRGLRFELFPLLERIEATQPRPAVVASIRDILQVQEKAGRDQESLGWAQRWFDAVLVHGDARFVRLEDTFPLATGARVPIHYTGFVTAPGPGPARLPRELQREVVVSAGGGATGTHVLEAAIHARAHSALRELTWRVLAGPGVTEERFRALVAMAVPGVVVERNRPDFPALLAAARVSVSQAGYNTVMDVLRSGAPAVLVPFEGRAETEQRARAQRLAELGVLVVLDERELGPETLAAAVDRAASRDAVGRWSFDTDGAARTSALLREIARSAAA